MARITSISSLPYSYLLYTSTYSVQSSVAVADVLYTTDDTSGRQCLLYVCIYRTALQRFSDVNAVNQAVPWTGLVYEPLAAALVGNKK